MRNYLIPIVSGLFLFLHSCGGDTDNVLREAIGGKMYGGVFKFMSAEKVKSLFPLATSNIYTQRLNAQLFEPLLKIDRSSRG